MKLEISRWTFSLTLPCHKEQFKLENSPQLKGLKIEGSKVVEHSIPPPCNLQLTSTLRLDFTISSIGNLV